MSNVKEIYQEYLRNIRDNKNSSRYVGMESYHHSSRAGLCMRKHYYGSVAQVDGKPVDDKTLRIFRIGDLIHKDIQDAMRWYADSHALPIFIEKELFIEEYNVRGFIDLALVSDDILFDIKTCNSWKWRSMFGKKFDPDPTENYSLQLATYGIWYEQEYGALKGMKLLYYNKDNSDMREIDVPMIAMEKAHNYWTTVMAIAHDVEEPPAVELGTAPVYKWECNAKYCDYYDVCGGLEGLINLP